MYQCKFNSSATKVFIWRYEAIETLALDTSSHIPQNTSILDVLVTVSLKEQFKLEKRKKIVTYSPELLTPCSLSRLTRETVTICEPN